MERTHGHPRAHSATAMRPYDPHQDYELPAPPRPVSSIETGSPHIRPKPWAFEQQDLQRTWKWDAETRMDPVHVVNRPTFAVCASITKRPWAQPDHPPPPLPPPGSSPPGPRSSNAPHRRGTRSAAGHQRAATALGHVANRPSTSASMQQRQESSGEDPRPTWARRNSFRAMPSGRERSGSVWKLNELKHVPIERLLERRDNVPLAIDQPRWQHFHKHVLTEEEAMASVQKKYQRDPRQLSLAKLREPYLTYVRPQRVGSLEQENVTMKSLGIPQGIRSPVHGVGRGSSGMWGERAPSGRASPTGMNTPSEMMSRASSGRSSPGRHLAGRRSCVRDATQISVRSEMSGGWLPSSKGVAFVKGKRPPNPDSAWAPCFLIPM